MFRSAIVIILTVLTPAMLAATANPAIAQTVQEGSQTKTNEAPSPQGQVPPDHYDPDDAKTWPDVVTEDREISVRGRQFIVHFYRSRSVKTSAPAIYACGDGGWRGLAPRTAQQLAHMGFPVAGVDSKVYLREFSSVQTPLTIKQLASDYVDIARALRTYAGVDSDTPVYVYGWSLGAGFAIAVGSDQATRQNWAGIISIGLPKQNQLVSGVGGNRANLNMEINSLYGFRSADVMALISPLPLLMIQSTTDTASPVKVGNQLFAAARDPKRYVLIKASNHRFSGAREEFYEALGGVSWMRESAKSLNGTHLQP